MGLFILVVEKQNMEKHRYFFCVMQLVEVGRHRFMHIANYAIYVEVGRHRFMHVANLLTFMHIGTLLCKYSFYVAKSIST